ncbi:MAG TPA: NUDIX domain-containing protein [Stellaceae bacterium]|nr:NUDIX domain-containing protein [Stellaceae bacterium]
MTAAGDPFLDDDRILSPSDAAAAILVAPDGYLLQLRDDKPGIFYPGHWGCFGGAIEPSDPSVEAGLRRELAEELAIELPPGALRYFTTMTFDLGFIGMGIVERAYYEARLAPHHLANLRLGEGSRFAVFAAREALSLRRVTPYDAFALWLHANSGRLKPRSPTSETR